MNEIKYELKKDISTPNGYIRAGVVHTESEWQELYPKCSCYGNSEWFISLDKSSIQVDSSIEDTIIKDVFSRLGLRSISYKQAALECMMMYKKHLAKTVRQEIDDSDSEQPTLYFQRR